MAGPTQLDVCVTLAAAPMRFVVGDP